ncbi:Uncharacterised protein [Yersinia rohdei]|uniref:Uncharacterized protein n=1 Tax=Yersinia rohdei TaxID=29485 RepID=A0A0U1HUQ4_YERRO|nr:hypothetical protein [Yersinia rohdei]CQI92607.1 Uncharacterised protein [Yersinia rohdei]
MSTSITAKTIYRNGIPEDWYSTENDDFTTFWTATSFVYFSKTNHIRVTNDTSYEDQHGIHHVHPFIGITNEQYFQYSLIYEDIDDIRLGQQFYSHWLTINKNLTISAISLAFSKNDDFCE